MISVYKNKNGKWTAFVRYKDWQGKPRAKKKEIFKTRREALEYERDFLQKKTRDIEVKQYMIEPVKIGMSGDWVKLTMNISITQTGSIKPAEILELLYNEYGLPVALGRALINRSKLMGQGKDLIDLV